jgi:hypothetical protein
MVFFNGKVTFEVAVQANDFALEPSRRAFTVSFLAKSFFSSGARHVCCLISFFVGIANTATNVGVGRSGGGVIFSLFEIRADVDVFVENEVVEMESLAHIDSNFMNIELLGYMTLLEVK